MAGASEGLKNSLNGVRMMASLEYKENVPIIDDETSIEQFSKPILEFTAIKNEFIGALIQRIVYTQFETKIFRNPLKVLEGDQLPLGYAGQEIYVNPAKARSFDGEDFAGLLKKYETDVKVQYMEINRDNQYPVTISRQALKKAFVSWTDLETFITNITNSLYNGAYIDEYNYTKYIISSAYKQDKAIIEQINALDDESMMKAFIEKARTLFLNFQTPSSKFNAWKKVKPDDATPITTFTNPEDIVFILRNDIRSKLDVNVLASAFNIEKSTLMGNIISVNDFDAYKDDGTQVYDGSKIIGMIADKSWFRIKTQDMFLDTFYNPNNRTMQYYLNIIKMYNMSLFANGVIFATELPN